MHAISTLSIYVKLQRDSRVAVWKVSSRPLTLVKIISDNRDDVLKIGSPRRLLSLI